VCVRSVYNLRRRLETHNLTILSGYVLITLWGDKLRLIGLQHLAKLLARAGDACPFTVCAASSDIADRCIEFLLCRYSWGSLTPGAARHANVGRIWH
jgi:hypothetical protein